MTINVIVFVLSILAAFAIGLSIGVLDTVTHDKQKINDILDIIKDNLERTELYEKHSDTFVSYCQASLDELNKGIITLREEHTAIVDAWAKILELYQANEKILIENSELEAKMRDMVNPYMAIDPATGRYMAADEEAIKRVTNELNTEEVHNGEEGSELQHHTDTNDQLPGSTGTPEEGE